MAEGHRVCAVETQSSHGVTTALKADAVIFACGGFQGNSAMMRTYFGPEAKNLKLISPGTCFDTGDGIRMALDQGASASGDWNGMHIEPIDPRSQNSAPVVLVYPYGIVVDQDGRRFFDEGGGPVHETWEVFSRDIHFVRKNGIAYAILDSHLFDIEGYQRAIRSEVPPYQAETLEGLAAQIGIPARHLRETVDTFNAAANGDVARFDAARCDGLAAADTLDPPKSNWARAITKPPYLAYPWSAPSPTHLAVSPPMRKRKSWASVGRCRASTLRERSPGIFTELRRMRFRCFALWFLEKLQAERLLTS